MTWSLFKILMSNNINFSFFKDNLKSGPKGIAKVFGVFVLILVCLAEFLFIFGSSMVNIYMSLKQSNSTFLMPQMCFNLSMLLTAFFAFISTASGYYNGKEEEFLISLPLLPRQFFTAKFCISLVIDSLFAIFMSFIGFGVYGYYEGLLSSPGFYFGVISITVFICLVVVFIIYLFFIVVLCLIPALRSKKAMQSIAIITLLIVCFFSGFFMSFFNQNNSEIILKLMPTVKEKNIVYNVINGKFILGLILLAISFFIFFGLVPLFSKIYLTTLNGFSDVKTKKISDKKIEYIFSKKTKSQSALKALYVRDVKTVLQEPAYFLNGPLVIFILPITFSIFIFIFLSQAVIPVQNDLLQIIEGIDKSIFKEYILNITYVLAIFTSLIGGMSGIAGTSFSREGKSLFGLKALPLKTESIILAKFLHAFTYSVIINVIVLLIFVIASLLLNVKILLVEIAAILIMQTILSLAISIILILIDMVIDIINPKLNWENPISAFKQNLNIIFSFFFNFLVIGIVGLLAFMVLPKTYLSYFIILGLVIILDIFLGYWFMKFSKKRFINLEGEE